MCSSPDFVARERPRRPDPDKSVAFCVSEEYSNVVEQARDGCRDEERKVESVAEIEDNDTTVDDGYKHNEIVAVVSYRVAIRRFDSYSPTT